MLRQSPMTYSPRWSLLAGGGLLTLAMSAVIGARADTGPGPMKSIVVAQASGEARRPAADEKGPARKPERKEERQPALDIEEILKQVLESLPPEMQEKVKEQVKKAMERAKRLQERLPGLVPPNVAQNPEEIRKAFEEMRKRLADAQEQRGFGLRGGEGRLGVQVSSPDEVLALQLNLPQGQGLVIGPVRPDSPAAKAGLQPRDVLVELNGKAVPSNPREFARLVHELKAGSVDAVVLRKGKRETIKGITLPEAGSGRRLSAAPFRLVFGEGGPLHLELDASGGALVATARVGNQLKTCYEKDGVKIVVAGEVSEGRLQLRDIEVRDGDTTEKFTDLARVREQYRERAKHAVELAEKAARAK